MQVVTFYQRGPFVTDKGGEPTRIVVLLGRIDRHVPRRAVRRRAGQRSQGRWKSVLREGHDDLDRGVDGILPSGLHHVVPPLAGRVCQQLRVSFIEAREKAHVVRMVRHYQEVQRS